MATTRTLTAVVGANGAAEAVDTIPTGREFALSRMAASGSGRSGELRVYLNSDLIDGTASACADWSDLSQDVQLQANDQIKAVWSGCTPGATMRLTLRGNENPAS